MAKSTCTCIAMLIISLQCTITYVVSAPTKGLPSEHKTDLSEKVSKHPEKQSLSESSSRDSNDILSVLRHTEEENTIEFEPRVQEKETNDTLVVGTLEQKKSLANNHETEAIVKTVLNLSDIAAIPSSYEYSNLETNADDDRLLIRADTKNSKVESNNKVGLLTPASYNSYTTSSSLTSPTSTSLATNMSNHTSGFPNHSHTVMPKAATSADTTTGINQLPSSTAFSESKETNETTLPKQAIDFPTPNSGGVTPITSNSETGETTVTEHGLSISLDVELKDNMQELPLNDNRSPRAAAPVVDWDLVPIVVYDNDPKWYGDPKFTIIDDYTVFKMRGCTDFSCKDDF